MKLNADLTEEHGVLFEGLSRLLIEPQQRLLLHFFGQLAQLLVVALLHRLDLQQRLTFHAFQLARHLLLLFLVVARKPNGPIGGRSKRHGNSGTTAKSMAFTFSVSFSWSKRAVSSSFCKRNSSRDVNFPSGQQQAKLQSKST